MDDQAEAVNKLLERVKEYGNLNLELLKLKAIDKTADVVSTILPNAIVFTLIAVFLLFLNIGVSFWLGAILGNVVYGFLVVAGFNGVIATIAHLFLRKPLKRHFGNIVVKQLLK